MPIEAQSGRDPGSRLTSDVALALTRDTTFPERSQACCQALVDHLGAAFARIWLLDRTERVLKLQASAGLYTHLDGAHALVPVGSKKIGLIAEEGEPHLTNDVLGDPRVSEKDWARREGMVAFAGYPLMLGERVLGVMAMFSRRELPDATLELLERVARLVSLAFERNRLETEHERFRDFFLAMLGHDLRSPLGTIALSTELLRAEGGTGEDGLRALERIARSAGRMERMVNDLLDFARTASGERVPIRAKPVDMAQVCRDVAEELRSAHPDRTVEHFAEGEVRGYWDPDRLAQAVANLAQNAIAHGGRESVVTIRAERSEDGVRVSVHNRGNPIEASRIPHLFDPYRGFSGGRRGRGKGLGLGLYITAQIARAHDGRVIVDSDAEHGTTFRLLLPLGSSG